MLDAPEIITTTAETTAIIRLTIPRAQIHALMGPAIGELFATVSAQRVGPTGPLYSHHLRLDPEVFDFEVGVPVSGEVVPTGRVAGRVTPGGAARAHRPYDGLGAAWGAFDRWMVGQGLVGGPDLWECYAKGPESASDPALWQTVLNRPLVSTS
ncbi:MAG: AraC family transcriptional regulator [Myxococcales bacterium]|nr:AraC family transcriptional regulator [Myxococcales bacterium]